MHFRDSPFVEEWNVERQASPGAAASRASGDCSPQLVRQVTGDGRKKPLRAKKND
jgi:hypothetical protein